MQCEAGTDLAKTVTHPNHNCKQGSKPSMQKHCCESGWNGYSVTKARTDQEKRAPPS